MEPDFRKRVAERLWSKAREIDEALGVLEGRRGVVYFGSGPSFVEVDVESARKMLRSLAQSVKRGLRMFSQSRGA